MFCQAQQRPKITKKLFYMQIFSIYLIYWNKVIFSTNFTIISKKIPTREVFLSWTKKKEKQLSFYLIDSLLQIIALRNTLYFHKGY